MAEHLSWSKLLETLNGAVHVNLCVHVTGTDLSLPGRIQKMKEPWMNQSCTAVCDYRGSMSLVFDPDFRTQASEDTTKPSSNQVLRWTTRRLRSTSFDGDPSDAKPKHHTLKLTCKREQMNPGSARSSVWSCPPGKFLLTTLEMVIMIWPRF